MGAVPVAIDAGTLVVAAIDAGTLVVAATDAWTVPAAAIDAGRILVVLQHLFQAGGLPAVVLLSAVAALVAVADALSVAPSRAVVAATAALGAGSLGVGGVMAWGDAAHADVVLVVGLGVLGAAAAVAAFGARLRLHHLLLASVAATAAVALAVGPTVEAFGWRRPTGLPVQSFALAFAGAGFLPLGYAGRRRTVWLWPLAVAVVAAPFVVALPTVPVGGLGPFLVGVTLLPWAAVAAAAGGALFSLGWVAAGAAADRPSGPRPGRDR